MPIRKVALVGCQRGPWVPVADMKVPELRKTPKDIKVSVDRQGDFLRITVLDPPPYDHILCEVVDAVG